MPRGGCATPCPVSRWRRVGFHAQMVWSALACSAGFPIPCTALRCSLICLLYFKPPSRLFSLSVHPSLPPTLPPSLPQALPVPRELSPARLTAPIRARSKGMERTSWQLPPTGPQGPLTSFPCPVFLSKARLELKTRPLPSVLVPLVGGHSTGKRAEREAFCRQSVGCNDALFSGYEC